MAGMYGNLTETLTHEMQQQVAQQFMLYGSTEIPPATRSNSLASTVMPSPLIPPAEQLEREQRPRPPTAPINSVYDVADPRRTMTLERSLEQTQEENKSRPPPVMAGKHRSMVRFSNFISSESDSNPSPVSPVTPATPGTAELFEDRFNADGQATTLAFKVRANGLRTPGRAKYLSMVGATPHRDEIGLSSASDHQAELPAEIRAAIADNVADRPSFQKHATPEFPSIQRSSSRLSQREHELASQLTANVTGQPSFNDTPAPEFDVRVSPNLSQRSKESDYDEIDFVNPDWKRLDCSIDEARAHLDGQSIGQFLVHRHPTASLGLTVVNTSFGTVMKIDAPRYLNTVVLLCQNH